MSRLFSLPCALLFVGLVMGGAGSAVAQKVDLKDDAKDNGKGIKLGKEQVHKLRCGVRIVAVGGPCQGLFCTIPVPTEWPEQSVRKVDEDVTPTVRQLEFRDIGGGGARQMLISIPLLPANDEARAIITYEIVKRDIEAPKDTSIYTPPKTFGRELGPYVIPSQYIESRADRIVKLAKQVTSGKDTAWDKAEAIYDWVQANIKYQDGPIKGAMAALRDGHGDCEELSSLFIAMCRASGIPARTVWLPGHCYPEFFLLDDEKQGHWFPCQAAGDKMFGAMVEKRAILQKGDSFVVPGQKGKVRYVSEFLTGAGGKPKVTWVREDVKD